MRNGWIAVVGSVDESRTFDPPIKNAPRAREAAHALGRQLARDGFGIVVYSLESHFIEADVVKGYIGAESRPARESVRVILPQGKDPSVPHEFEHAGDAFHITNDRHGNWEVSFYRSLIDVDGVVLIGGGRSTFITGMLALTYRIPMLALAAYGGSAAACWPLIDESRDLPSKDEIQAMNKPASDTVVVGWSAALQEQRKRRRQRERRRFKPPWSAIAAFLLLLGWVLTLPWGFSLSATAGDNGSKTPFLILLFTGPLLAGASGASFRALLSSSSSLDLRKAVLGMGAGAVTALLYVAPQFVANTALPNGSVLLVFALLTGFLGGLTSDVVFQKLSAAQVVDTSAVPQVRQP